MNMSQCVWQKVSISSFAIQHLKNPPQLLVPKANAFRILRFFALTELLIPPHNRTVWFLLSRIVSLMSNGTICRLLALKFSFNSNILKNWLRLNKKKSHPSFDSFLYSGLNFTSRRVKFIFCDLSWKVLRHYKNPTLIQTTFKTFIIYSEAKKKAFFPFLSTSRNFEGKILGQTPLWLVS